VKRGLKPTREQRKFLALHGIEDDTWLISKDTSTEMVLVHREDSSITRTIQKQAEETAE